MLMKLMKYDILFGAKRYAVLFALLCGTWLSGLVVSMIDNSYLNTLCLVLNVMVTIFFAFAYMVTGLQLYYGGMSGDECIFSYTIPVKTASLVFSKLAVIWMWGIAMATGLVLVWFSLYHTLLADMDITILFPEGMIGILVSMLAAQFLLLSCMLAFAVSLFNIPRLKVGGGGIVIVAVAAYLMTQALGLVELGIFALIERFLNPELLSRLWNGSLSPDDELTIIAHIRWVCIGTTALLGPLFFALTVRTVERHRSV